MRINTICGALNFCKVSLGSAKAGYYAFNSQRGKQIYCVCAFGSSARQADTNHKDYTPECRKHYKLCLNHKHKHIILPFTTCVNSI